jgi:hypothetical protein
MSHAAQSSEGVKDAMSYPPLVTNIDELRLVMSEAIGL